MAVSLAKVADVDKSLGNNDLAVRDFQEAINCLESLTLNSNETVVDKPWLLSNATPTKPFPA